MGPRGQAACNFRVWFLVFGFWFLVSGFWGGGFPFLVGASNFEYLFAIIRLYSFMAAVDRAEVFSYVSIQTRE